MQLKHKIAAGVVAALAVAGGGAAVAATQLGSPKEESQALIINDAAKELGVQPDRLSAALKQAYKNRVDAAVQAGRLTKEQGEELKQRIDANDVPLLGVPHRFGPAFGPHGRGFAANLETAATYLGLTGAELRSRLESGKTLADIAKAQGKSVEGLVQALYDEAKKHLDEEVAEGDLTKAQEDEILSHLKERLTDLVNGEFPPPPFGGRGDRFGHGDRMGVRPAFGAVPGFVAPDRAIPTT